MMLYHNILVTGAFSGIGKAFVRAYLKDSSNAIVAIDKKFPRQSSSPSQMTSNLTTALDVYREEVGDDKTRPRVSILSMDITDESLLYLLDPFHGLELVIHSAGIRALVPFVPISQSSDVTQAESLEVMSSQTMLQAFRINTLGTFLLLRTLMPNLRHNDGKVIVMGSRMGSIGHNATGGGYAYRASKAALNAVMKSFSVDVPDVCFVTVHPGRVKSNLVGEGIEEEGAIEAEESAKGVLELIPRLGKEDSGRFVDRFGEDIEW